MVVRLFITWILLDKMWIKTVCASSCIKNSTMEIGFDKYDRCAAAQFFICTTPAAMWNLAVLIRLVSLTRINRRQKQWEAWFNCGKDWVSLNLACWRLFQGSQKTLHLLSHCLCLRGRWRRNGGEKRGPGMLWTAIGNYMMLAQGPGIVSDVAEDVLLHIHRE